MSLPSSRLTFLVVLALCIAVTPASGANKTCGGIQKCKKGILLPVWEPSTDLSVGDKVARAIVYGAALCYMFVGVSIVADRFMASIEVITSKEKEVVIKKSDGTEEIINVRIWNETVSNLTLMALGSSAPEILLSVIEIFGNKFEAGDLGPSTIVGSAAFNLFVIIGFCVSVIPNGEVRRIKHLRVFFITATWSIFAYLWLYLIIAVISRNVIEVWEGVLTFLFFPLTVITAYIADKKILVYRFLAKRYRRGGKGVLVATEGDVEMAESGELPDGDVVYKGLYDDNDEVREFEKHRKDFIDTLRELRKKHPDMEMKKLEEMAQFESLNKGPKSRAFYRIQATRKLMGGGNVVKKQKIHDIIEQEEEEQEEEDDDGIVKIYFDPGHYTVLENVGDFDVTVSRRGGDPSLTVHVDYVSEDGTANANSDYIPVHGTLTFNAGETHKQFTVGIIDDDVFEEDEHFYIKLQHLRVSSGGHDVNNNDPPVAQLITPSLATVMILDDDHGGIFHFEESENTIVESCGRTEIKVLRSSGARGIVRLPYWTIDGTSKNGRGYECIGTQELCFVDEQTEGFIRINITDDEQYQKNEQFYVQLGEPYHVKAGPRFFATAGNLNGSHSSSLSGRSLSPHTKYKHSELKDAQMSEEERKTALLGAPRLGELTKAAVIIRESEEFKATVDSLVKRANVSLMLGTSSWREQFSDAITVSSGDDEDAEDDEEAKLPSCMDYVMHYLTVFWKVVFAAIPPTDYVGGWVCFCVSIIMVGALTAIIGDLASMFGCTIGLTDAVTAISFVALGTSVPDTFASKVAAIQDQYADSSVGNVTGSNAVNVFLGIGIAWTCAAVYHWAADSTFRVEPGSLGFSVTIFCIMAVVCILLMLVRRNPKIGGELGGPVPFKYLTSMFMIGLWLSYITLSALENYCIIKGF